MALILSGDTGPSFVQSAAMPTGSVIQTVFQNYTTYTYASASASYADTGLQATITPQFSTSKIFITLSMNGLTTTTTTSGNVNWIITDGSNNQLFVVSAGQISSYNSIPWTTECVTYVHSPATTSAFTYKLRAAGPTQGWQINNYNSQPGGATPTSGIVLMEIKQ